MCLFPGFAGDVHFSYSPEQTHVLLLERQTLCKCFQVMMSNTSCSGRDESKCLSGMIMAARRLPHVSAWHPGRWPLTGRAASAHRAAVRPGHGARGADASAARAGCALPEEPQHSLRPSALINPTAMPALAYPRSSGKENDCPSLCSSLVH